MSNEHYRHRTRFLRTALTIAFLFESCPHVVCVLQGTQCLRKMVARNCFIQHPLLNAQGYLPSFTYIGSLNRSGGQKDFGFLSLLASWSHLVKLKAAYLFQLNWLVITRGRFLKIISCHPLTRSAVSNGFSVSSPSKSWSNIARVTGVMSGSESGAAPYGAAPDSDPQCPLRQKGKE